MARLVCAADTRATSYWRNGSLQLSVVLAARQSVDFLLRVDRPIAKAAKVIFGGAIDSEHSLHETVPSRHASSKLASIIYSAAK